ncbi:MAG: helix-turn-helix domain-containing protein [Planctomycetota bacterium]|jgi:transcriptional regulator with XRE-family HTH domain
MLEVMSKILDEIRKAIKASDKSRYRLSKETSIPQSQLSRLMTGEKGLSFEALERLTDALGLEIIVQKKKTRKPAKPKVKHGKCGK